MTKPWLGLAVALVLLAMALVAVRLVSGATPRPGPQAPPVAPTVRVTAGLGSRAWFVTPQVGWVLVQVPTAGLPRMELYRTADGGSSWQRQLAWTGGAAPEVARFFGPSQAFLVARVDGGPRRIFTTVDGSQWRAGEAPPSVAAVSFVDADLGWAVHREGTTVVVDRTVDGGRSWRPLAAFAAPREPDTPRWVEFVDERNGLMGGLAEGRLTTLYATHDGGATWAATALPAAPERVGAGASTVLSGARALAGGVLGVSLSLFPREGQSYARSYLYVSVDGGRTWSPPRALPGAQWQALDARRVVATSGRDLFSSHDGGRTWRRTEASLPAFPAAAGAAYAAPQFAAPAFVDERAGWATLVTTQVCQTAARPQNCAEHPQIGWAVARTSDGGSSWSLVNAHA